MLKIGALNDLLLQTRQQQRVIDSGSFTGDIGKVLMV
jgi:hypothetical protein